MGKAKRSAGRKIRICYVLNNFGMGGAETVALDLARMHSPLRYEVEVLAALEGSDTGISEMHRRFLEAGVATHVIRQRNFRNPLSLWRLYSYLKTGGFDLVLGHNRGSDYWAVRLGRLAGVPHRFWTRHLTYLDMSPRQLQKYRNIAAVVDRVVAVSEAVREACIHTEGIPAEKVITIVNGIDLGKYRPLTAPEKIAKRTSMGWGQAERILLFVGRLSDQKAPEAFVDLVRLAQEQDPGLRGVMCGAGPLQTALEERVRVSGARVDILGMRPDVPALLGAADLFVSTSRNEGLPLNVMEAMSAGLPFVGPGIPQIRELTFGFPEMEGQLTACPPAEGLVPGKIVQQWAEVIMETLGDANRLEVVGRIGRDIICDHFSLEKMVRGYEEIFDQAMSGP